MKETLQGSSFSRPNDGGDGLPDSAPEVSKENAEGAAQSQPGQKDLTHSSGRVPGLEPASDQSEQADGEHTVTYVEPARNEISAFENVNEHEQTVISQRPVAAPEEFYRSMPLAELAEMLEGRHLDHFSVEQMIGGGGMGAVFRGLDMRLDRVVAVKVIPASKRDPETLRRFRLEAQAAARLDHPNIARVYYVGEAEQWNYIVFEFIDGTNIRDLVERTGVLSVDDAVYYTRQVAEALQHAQDRDVVHRDIKPSNVLVTASGIAKVVDMGLARDTSMDKSTADATSSGMTLGTFDYIAPEQARNPRDADVRSDIYSLGCTLFYMLTGSPPFPDGTALQKLLNHGSQPPPDPRSWREDLSDELVDIIMKMMAKKPGERYQRPEELVSDLVRLAEYEHLPRTLSPGTLMLNPLVSQLSLLESNLPWLVALAFLTGSTLWLQSFDSFSKGLTLPEIKLKQPAALEPVSTGQRAALPSDATLPEVLPARPVTNEGASTSAIPSSPTAGSSSGLFSQEPNGEPGVVESNATSGVVRTPNETPGTEALASELPGWNESGGSEIKGLSSQPLIVSTRRPLGLESVFWRSTLEEALKEAKPDQSVEIRGDIVVSKPLVLSGTEMSLADVKLVGSQTEPGSLVIDPALFEVAAFGSETRSRNPLSAAIQLKAIQLTLDNVAVRLDLARDSKKANRNVFGLAVGASLNLINSSVSVKSTLPGETSVIEVLEDDFGGRSGIISDDGSRVALRNCVIRGGATAVVIRSINPVQRRAIEVGFENALLAVDGHAIALYDGGNSELPSSFVKVLCSRSTILSRRGFASLQYAGERPTLGINRTSKNSLFWATKGVPHIAIEAKNASLVENPNLLLLQGADNSYDESIMTLVSQSGAVVAPSLAESVKSYSFNEGQAEGWWIERGTERLIRWRTPVDQADPFSSAKPSDFRVNESMFSPGFQSDYQLAPQLGVD